VGTRGGLDAVEKRKFLTLPGLELRPLDRPARSQSLYRLRCPGSNKLRVPNLISKKLLEPNYISSIHYTSTEMTHFCSSSSPSWVELSSPICQRKIFIRGEFRCSRKSP
jgi:hypothetical protein